MAKDGRKQQAAADLRLRELLRVPRGEQIDLGAYDTRTAYDARTGPAGPKDKSAGLKDLAHMGKRLAGLQERLWAAGTEGDVRRVLLVLQGMDTSGKGGTVKHVVGLFNPAGCRVRGFKVPTPEEREHDFLWRIEKELPRPGEIGAFDRSHYEDVLVPRVRALVPREEIERRYDEINRFEQRLADDRVTVIKCFLHISAEQQRRRLLRRLDRPDKRWKFSPSDIDDRALWPAYQEAYEIALHRCSTPHAPWYLIPADRKWFRNWAVARLLLEHLEALDPRYPEPDYDLEECRKRMLAH
ncbi:MULTISPECIES: PPK2 family polyphosphate kinase [unclassified Streptomyces]|uniref:PPK2 family polyphosphate kinase n=1 Tax=unclassified Streptomyces TaxID=2593676 RepID=UPI00225459B5|nr:MULTISPECIES: PPK2 family polyphosphate kinase [unclassified Streptomyces]MCX5051758.1 polyphosphate kinase 2 family protein [Streptomyces sp. NBC_00474]